MTAPVSVRRAGARHSSFAHFRACRATSITTSERTSIERTSIR